MVAVVQCEVGDVRHERPAERHVDELGPAADAEHGDVAVHGTTDDVDAEPVGVRVDAVLVRCRAVDAIELGVDVAAAEQQHRIGVEDAVGLWKRCRGVDEVPPRPAVLELLEGRAREPAHEVGDRLGEVGEVERHQDGDARTVGLAAAHGQDLGELDPWSRHDAPSGSSSRTAVGHSLPDTSSRDVTTDPDSGSIAMTSRAEASGPSASKTAECSDMCG